MVSVWRARRYPTSILWVMGDVVRAEYAEDRETDAEQAYTVANKMQK